MANIFLVSQQNMKNLENIGHIVLGTVRLLMLIEIIIILIIIITITINIIIVIIIIVQFYYYYNCRYYISNHYCL